MRKTWRLFPAIALALAPILVFTGPAKADSPSVSGYSAVQDVSISNDFYPSDTVSDEEITALTNEYTRIPGSIAGGDSYSIGTATDTTPTPSVESVNYLAPETVGDEAAISEAGLDGVGAATLAAPVLLATGEGLALKWEWDHFSHDGTDSSYTGAPTGSDAAQAADSFPLSDADNPNRVILQKSYPADPNCSQSRPVGVSCDVGSRDATTADATYNHLGSDQQSHFGDGVTEQTSNVSSTVNNGATAANVQSALSQIVTDHAIYQCQEGGGDYYESPNGGISQFVSFACGTGYGTGEILDVNDTFNTQINIPASAVHKRYLAERSVCSYVTGNGGGGGITLIGVAQRSALFNADDKAPPTMSFAPCPPGPSSSYNAGTIVRRQVIEMPSNTTLYDWKASPRYLDSNDPAFACLNNMVSCTVHATDTSKPANDTDNPCEYGSVQMPATDCLLAQPSTWENVLTKTKADSQPDTEPSDSPSDSPSDNPSPSASPEPSTEPSDPTRTDPQTTPLAGTQGDTDCVPSGWSVFNPVKWVYMPVKCAMRWAFVPPDGLSTDWNNETDDLKQTSPVKAVLAGQQIIADAQTSGDSSTDCQTVQDSTKTNNPTPYTFDWCPVLAKAADFQQHSTMGTIFETLMKLALVIFAAVYSFKRISHSVGGAGE